ncbi:aminotransferase class V-fold PLP-dependent enzyme [Limibacillus halophilus]|uniref:Cysteine desulfurase n=1 Tax=Limibacillus halophilus TaxID=1579333 RepID=A0A839STI1_9PROT|nr:aminotransferase class V-fold PLP-dependent enzyme [Limibacillus halophilus]MBB3065020.1 cysteine desulfurase [Limibacillus halophilus]
MTKDNTPKTPVYLDYQATTPLDPRVFKAMEPYFTEFFANPHSVEHSPGRAVAAAVEEAREQVAALIGADPREVIFTSGATEANNLAIKGAARFLRRHKGLDHIVTLATEHKCVLESVRALEREGFRATYLPVLPSGLVDMDKLALALESKTALVCVMAVNNETGVIQPLARIGALCRARGVLFHSDAAQAAGRIALDMEAMQIDLLSLSSHKIYGPKGMGALYVRRRPRVRLEPLFDGGGQERGLRSGTLPAPLCIGFGEACRIAGEERESDNARVSALRARLLDGLRARVEGVTVNGEWDQRIAGNLNLRFAGVNAQSLIAAVPDLAFSTGSACSSAEVEPSYVLGALGLDEAQSRQSMRLALGRFTSEVDVDFAVATLSDAVRALRAQKRQGAAE